MPERIDPFYVCGKGNLDGDMYSGTLTPGGPLYVYDDNFHVRTYAEDIIPGIQSIRLVYDPGFIYDYTIEVIGACPRGYTSNQLQFQDQTGDIYTLTIFSGTTKKHTVNFNSVKPNINYIKWHIGGL